MRLEQNDQEDLLISPVEKGNAKLYDELAHLDILTQNVNAYISKLSHDRRIALDQSLHKIAQEEGKECMRLEQNDQEDLCIRLIENGKENFLAREIETLTRRIQEHIIAKG